MNNRQHWNVWVFRSSRDGSIKQVMCCSINIAQSESNLFEFQSEEHITHPIRMCSKLNFPLQCFFFCKNTWNVSYPIFWYKYLFNELIFLLILVKSIFTRNTSLLSIMIWKAIKKQMQIFFSHKKYQPNEI